MEHATRRYSAVIVHRRPDLEPQPINLGLGGHDRLGAAEAAWRIALDRAETMDYLLMESGGRILNAATVLGAERVTARDIAEMPHLEGRIRFITSHHVPDFVDELTGAEVDDEFRTRNPVRYATLVHDLVTARCASSRSRDEQQVTGATTLEPLRAALPRWQQEVTVT